MMTTIDDDIDALPTRLKRPVGRPPNPDAAARKERQLEIKERGLKIREDVRKTKERELDQRDEMLEALRDAREMLQGIKECLEVLTAVIVAHGTASAAITMRKKNT